MSKLSYISLCVIAPENLDKLDSPLGESKGDLPLLLEIQKPGGSLTSGRKRALPPLDFPCDAKIVS